MAVAHGTAGRTQRHDASLRLAQGSQRRVPEARNVLAMDASPWFVSRPRTIVPKPRREGWASFLPSLGDFTADGNDTPGTDVPG